MQEEKKDLFSPVEKFNRNKKKWISLFILIAIFSGAIFSFFYYQKWKEERLVDRHYKIIKIIQTGPQKEALKTVYLAELLDLSIDEPTSFFAFDEKSAKKKLLQSPLIKEAKVKKISPNTVYIDYTVRQPMAWLCDYENIAVDEEGYLFPVSPFFSPKCLPEIFLGLGAFGDEKGAKWHEPLQNRQWKLALSLYRLLLGAADRGCVLKKIDVSNAFVDSFGKREITLLVEMRMILQPNHQPSKSQASNAQLSSSQGLENKEILCIFPQKLRLGIKNFSQQLGNYFSLQDKMMSDYRNQLSKQNLSLEVMQFGEKTIDLRMDKIALID